MKRVIALVGRPNVGKSTLFNRLTKTRDALVADEAGLTRDRRYGNAEVGDHEFIVIDTGGIIREGEEVDQHIAAQARQAIEESDVVFFMVDGRAGPTADDELLARELRQSGRNVFVVANKTERMESDLVKAEFYSFGLGEPLPISAAHGSGTAELLEEVAKMFPDSVIEPEQDPSKGPKVAIVGRPNVGKSTLVNRLLGEERVVAMDMPGTTRDSIYIPLQRHGKNFMLIDTAGVRRRGRIDDKIEKFSVIKTLQAIDDANVVVLVLDAQQGLASQDMHLLGYVLERGRGLIIAMNKWDGLEQYDRDRIKQEIDRRLSFVGFASMHFISALHGTGVGDLLDVVQKVFETSLQKFSTPMLTRLLEDAVTQHSPPLVNGRRIKLRYAHQGGQNPPVIIIHGNQTERVPDSYRRYLSNVFREALDLDGTPIRIEFKTSDNPFEGRRNKLTPRQIHSRKRMMKHVKSRKK